MGGETGTVLMLVLCRVPAFFRCVVPLFVQVHPAVHSNEWLSEAQSSTPEANLDLPPRRPHSEKSSFRCAWLPGLLAALAVWCLALCFALACLPYMHEA
jgi:hypothetical protein